MAASGKTESRPQSSLPNYLRFHLIYNGAYRMGLRKEQDPLARKFCENILCKLSKVHVPQLKFLDPTPDKFDRKAIHMDEFLLNCQNSLFSVMVFAEEMNNGARVMANLMYTNLHVINKLGRIIQVHIGSDCDESPTESAPFTRLLRTFRFSKNFENWKTDADGKDAVELVALLSELWQEDEDKVAKMLKVEDKVTQVERRSTAMECRMTLLMEETFEENLLFRWCHRLGFPRKTIDVLEQNKLTTKQALCNADEETISSLITETNIRDDLLASIRVLNSSDTKFNLASTQSSNNSSKIVLVAILRFLSNSAAIKLCDRLKDSDQSVDVCKELAIEFSLPKYCLGLLEVSLDSDCLTIAVFDYCDGAPHVYLNHCDSMKTVMAQRNSFQTQLNLKPQVNDNLFCQLVDLELDLIKALIKRRTVSPVKITEGGTDWQNLEVTILDAKAVSAIGCDTKGHLNLAVELVHVSDDSVDLKVFRRSDEDTWSSEVVTVAIPVGGTSVQLVALQNDDIILKINKPDHYSGHLEVVSLKNGGSVSYQSPTDQPLTMKDTFNGHFDPFEGLIWLPNDNEERINRAQFPNLETAKDWGHDDLTEPTCVATNKQRIAVGNCEDDSVSVFNKQDGSMLYEKLWMGFATQQCVLLDEDDEVRQNCLVVHDGAREVQVWNGNGKRTVLKTLYNGFIGSSISKSVMNFLQASSGGKKTFTYCCEDGRVIYPINEMLRRLKQTDYISDDGLKWKSKSDLQNVTVCLRNL